MDKSDPDNHDWRSGVGPRACWRLITRQGHAARALREAETAPRLRELGDALANWAATYRELPSSDRTGNRAMPPHEAIRKIPMIAAENRRSQGNITSSFSMLDEFPEFGSVIGLIDLGGDIDRRLAELTELSRGFISPMHAIS
jgi:hypothetical protein